MEAEARLMKALAEPTRLRLAALLAAKGELCVCMLAGALGAPEFKVSRHLGVMRGAGLVEARRQGTWMYYRLTMRRSRFEKRLRECFRRCLLDHATAKADLKRLAGAKVRGKVERKRAA